MVEASLLRWHEVRDACRLIGECRDLGADPVLWQQRLLDGLLTLLDADAASGGQGSIVPLQQTTNGMAFEFAPAMMLCAGALPRREFLAWQREVGPNGCPIFNAMRRDASVRLNTRLRAQLVSDDEWQRSRSYQLRKGILDHQLTSVSLNAGSVTCVCVHRRAPWPDFCERERQLLEFLHDEVAQLVGRALASSAEPDPSGLSPRLKQTLACLLEGDSEKQIAARLGLSPSTAHQYVTSLYRHFGVRSRGQLLALAFKRASSGSWNAVRLLTQVDAG